MLHRSPLTVATGLVAAMVMMITGSATASAASSDYAVGDCYSTGDFDHDEISLSSKVPCTSTHAMQIIVGSPIPKKLLAAGYARLRDQSSKTYKALDLYAWNSACTTTKMAKAFYANQGAAVGQGAHQEQVARVPSR